MDSKTFVVPNISCGHCVHTNQNEVSEVKGVKSVKADQQTKVVTVQWEAPATWAEIEKLLTEIDYPPQRN
jgi:copper chaperone CopZ